MGLVPRTTTSTGLLGASDHPQPTHAQPLPQMTFLLDTY
jgi:hypothetical protein